MLPMAQGSSSRVPGVQVVHGPVVMVMDYEAEASGHDRRPQVVAALCKFLVDEVGSYPTVNCYLEKQYPNEAAKMRLKIDLMRLYTAVAEELPPHLHRVGVAELRKKPCLTKVPETNVGAVQWREVHWLDHNLPLWSMPFETSRYYSGGEPTVNVLTQLEVKLTRPPGTIVVSYHLAGLQNGVELPPFGVTIVVGAAQVLQAFLVAHALLHLQRWAVIPDTLDQKVVIHALIPRVLLNVFQVGVLVPVQEEYWRPEHWSRLYLHSTVAPGPNPLQVLAVIAGVARSATADWRKAVEAVNNSADPQKDWPGVQTRARRDCKKEPWIGKDMQHNMELIRQGGEAFQQRLQVG